MALFCLCRPQFVCPPPAAVSAAAAYSLAPAPRAVADAGSSSSSSSSPRPSAPLVLDSARSAPSDQLWTDTPLASNIGSWSDIACDEI